MASTLAKHRHVSIAGNILRLRSSRLFVSLAIGLAIPTYDKFEPGNHPYFTSPHQSSCNEDISGAPFSYTCKNKLVFGINHHHSSEFNPNSEWHRIRIGYPLSPVTLDYDANSHELRGVIEYPFLLIRTLLVITAWGLFEGLIAFLLSAHRKSDAARHGTLIMAKLAAQPRLIRKAAKDGSLYTAEVTLAGDDLMLTIHKDSTIETRETFDSVKALSMHMNEKTLFRISDFI